MKYLATPLLVALSVISTAAAQFGKHDNTLTPAHPEATKLDNPSLDFQTNQFLGTFQYQVPIEVAPARGGSEPELALGYGSSGGNGWCGVGWSLDVGFIQRDTEKRVPVQWLGTPGQPQQAYDDAERFTFSAAGASGKLVPEGGSAYRSEVDTGFAVFTLESSRWVATDRSGTKYYLGDTSISPFSRMTNPDWSGSGNAQTFRWAISRIERADGTRADFEYWDPALYGNQLYLKRIAYNGHAFGNFQPTHEVTFDLEDRAGQGGVNDDTFSYRSGYRVDTTKRLSAITNRVLNGGNWDLVRKYELEYEHSPSTDRSLLKRIRRIGNDGTSTLPTIEFDYTEQEFEFENPISWGPLLHQPSGAPSLGHWNAPMARSNGNNFGGFGSFTRVDMLDMNRDGLADRVLTETTGTFDRYFVQYNLGSDFDGTPLGMDNQLHEYPFVSTLNEAYPTYRASLGWTGQLTVGGTGGLGLLKVLDLDGDGFQDRIQAETIKFPSNPSLNFWVEKGIPDGFDTGSQWGPNWVDPGISFPANSGFNTAEWVSSDENESTLYIGGQVGATVAGLTDLTGDGKVDRVLRYREPATNRDSYYVQVNNGTGFDEIQEWDLGMPYDPSGGTLPFLDYWKNPFTLETGGQSAPNSRTAVGLFDLNGDGLPDRVTKLAENASSYSNFTVCWNTGAGFTDVETFGPLLYHDPAYEGHEYLGTPSSSMPYGQTVCGTSGSCSLAMLQDVNGDGLVDRLAIKDFDYNPTKPYDKWVFQLNRGTHFGPVQEFANISRLGQTLAVGNPSPLIFPNASMEYGGGNDNGQETWSRMMDVDGDGVLDRILRRAAPPYTDGYMVQLGKGHAPDLMKELRNGMGASVSVEYTPSTRWDNTDDNGVSQLSAKMQTVTKVSVDDGLGHAPAVTSYSYVGGMYDYARREFRGFHCVTEIDPRGTTTNTFFHQGGGRDGSAQGEYQDSFGKKGIPYRVETIGSDQQLYRVVASQVVETVYPSTRVFPRVVRTIDMAYEGLATPRTSLVEFDFDLNTGLILEERRKGEVNYNLANHTYTGDVNTDNITRSLTYASLSNASIVDKIELETLKDGSLARTNETQRLYFGSTGQLREEWVWTDWDQHQPTSAFRRVGRYTYDDYGNVETEEDGVSMVVHRTYETELRMHPHLTTVDQGGLGFVTETVFDPRSGQLKTSEDPNGLVSRFEFDEHFRLTERWLDLPSGGGSIWLETFDYQLGGATIGATQNYVHRKKNDNSDAAGHESWTYLDGRARPVQIRVEAEISNQFRVTDTVYEPGSELERETVPHLSSGSAYSFYSIGSLAETVLTYDPIGRVSANTPPSGESGSPTGAMTLAFKDGTDPWAIVKTDALGKKLKTFMDAHGRIVHVAEVFNGTDLLTDYEYNPAGQLIQVDDARGNRTTMTVDSRGRTVVLDDPDTGITSFVFDEEDREIERIDAKNQKIVNDYDALGRIDERRVYANQNDATPYETISYDYDVNPTNPSVFPVFKGQLFRMTDGAGWTRFGYDVRGRVLKERRRIDEVGAAYTIQRTYDDCDRVTSMTYPGGVVVAYEHDTGGNLDRVLSTAGTGGEIVFYDATAFNDRGQVEGIAFGNGVTTDFDYYDSTGRLKDIETWSGGLQLQDLSYAYNKVSNLLSVADGVPSHAGSQSAALTGITYDDLHRLKGYTRQTDSGPFSAVFDYDETGNLLKNTDSSPVDYTYPGHGLGVVRPHAVTTANGITHQYDANGNLAQRWFTAQPTANQALSYDPQNRLTQVVNSGNQTITFGYDGNGGRLFRKVGSEHTVWVGDAYELKDGEKLFHVLAAGRRICTFRQKSKKYVNINNPPPPGSWPKTAEYQYYHQDHLLGTNIITDKNGAVEHHYQYTAYGNVSHVTNNTVLVEPSNLFTDQVFDEATGLYFYGARYYDATLGRFVQPDPMVPDYYVPQFLNRYTYVNNNPLRWTDPTGNWPSWSWDEIKSGAMAAVGNTVAFAQGAANSVTFGASDWLIENGAELVAGEGALDDWDRRYAGARQVGEIAADAASFVASGGTTGLAKGVVKGVRAGYKGYKASRATKAAATAALGLAARTTRGGFNSFSSLKRALGPAGKGKQWHHVVEQSQVGKFGSQAIQTADNVVAIPTGVHRKISGFYSSKQPFTGGQTVRQWLGGQTFEQQRAFGQQVLRNFGVGQ